VFAAPTYLTTTTASQTTAHSNTGTGCWVITAQGVDAYGNAVTGGGSVPVTFIGFANSGNSAWTAAGVQITSSTPVTVVGGTATIYYFVATAPGAGQDTFVAGPATTPGITTSISET
jgi:hypothetical protein